MSLRSVFYTAAYCSPMGAGLAGLFYAAGANLPAAAFVGGVSLFSGMLTYAHHFLPKTFGDTAIAGKEVSPFPQIEAPEKIQEMFNSLNQRGEPVSAKLVMSVDDENIPDKTDLRHADTDVPTRLIRIGEHLMCEDNPVLETIVAHEMEHLLRPDRHAVYHADIATSFMVYMPFLSALTFLLPQGNVQASVICSLSMLAAQWHVARAAYRKIEYDCDEAAVKRTGNPEAAIYMLTRHIDQDEHWNLSYNHPPVYRRIDEIENRFLKKEPRQHVARPGNFYP